MEHKVLELFDALRNVGVRPRQNQLEQERIRLLNDATIMGLFMETIFLLFQFSVFGWFDFLLSFVRYVFVYSIFSLHFYQKIKIARLTFILFIPLLLTMTLINLRHDVFQITLFFVIFPAVIIILVPKFYERIVLVSYVVLSYLIGDIYNDFYPSTIPIKENPLMVLLSFCFITAWAFMFIDRFTKANREVLNQLAELSVDLKQTNQQLQENKIKIAKRQAQLEEYNKELENFAYIASHDLKTPLRNISSFLKLIQRKLHNHPNPSIIEYLDFASNSAKQMHYLVEDILEYSRLGDQSLLMTKVDMNEVLKKVQRNLLNTIEERNGKVVAQNELPSFFANETQLILLFQNFIENGLKYNQSEVPTVTISNESDKDWIIVHFQDNGLGIPKEYREKVFEMFKRLHHQSEYQGSGVGLAICKKIVEQYKGNISISQPQAGGSIFTIKIPKRKITESTN